MTKQTVQDLVRGYSIETTVAQAERVPRFADVVPLGTRLYIAHVPGARFEDIVRLAARLRAEGMEPTPHIVARRIENLTVLDGFLARLTGDAGVTEALVVAGDLASPSGELESSLQILESGVLEKHGIRTIGVAGHPEGHRDVAEPALVDALERKNAYAARTGARVHIVTQFVFSAAPVVSWEASHGRAIGALPVTVGLPGLASAKTLLKYAMECGVGPSLQAFSKRYASLTRLLTVSTPDETIAGLACHIQQTPGTRLSGVHFFTFGGFQKTADWANKVVEGAFELTAEGGLRVG